MRRGRHGDRTAFYIYGEQVRRYEWWKTGRRTNEESGSDGARAVFWLGVEVEDETISKQNPSQLDLHLLPMARLSRGAFDLGASTRPPPSRTKVKLTKHPRDKIC